MSLRFSVSYLSSCHLCFLVVLALVQLCVSGLKSDDVLCMDGERQALIRFKHDLIDEADRLGSWGGDETDCCRWAGIVCDNITGHVHQIRLRGLDGRCSVVDLMDIFGGFSSKAYQEGLKQRLGGHLNPSLMELKQLKYLDLSCNNFIKSQIPSFIGSLRNLRYLNLSRSHFDGMIPPQIGNLSELRVLSLGRLNDVSIMKMKWLSNLRRLHHLDMSSVDLGKATDWFQVINTLPSLVELRLSYCQLPNMHPHVSRLNVTSLNTLDISRNYLVKTFPQWIFSLANLVSLDLSSCDFDAPLPSSIYSLRNLTSLQELHAFGNRFMNSSSVLEGLPSNLKVLDISYCGISSSALHSLHNLTSLLTLSMAQNQLTKAIPISLGNLCNLRYIDLSHNNFGNIGLTYLLNGLFRCKSPRLESLVIRNSGISGPIPNSISRLSSLKMLVLSRNTLNGSIPDSIGKLSSLKELALSVNRLNGSIPDSIGQLSSLESLELWSNQLSGNLPSSLSQLLKLTYLDFSDNLLKGIVTEAHFAKLVSLKYLYGGGNNLTLKLQVANWIPSFQLLSLSLESWDLGPQFPLWLRSQRDLIQLDISNTHISSPMPPESFWTSFPNLTSLYMSRNHINGTLTLGILGNLDMLDLSFNEFTGKLSTISNASLTHLRRLDLSNNLFDGSLHHLLCLNGVKETHSLTLGYNYFSGLIPECWAKWPNLQLLSLEYNNLFGKIPRTLGYVHELQLLNLHGNKISGRLPASLMKLEKLEILQLGKNEIIGNIPSWIGTKFTFLKILNLRSNQLDGNLPRELCYLLDTQILDLAENNLSGSIPRCFYNFSAFSGKYTSLSPEINIFLHEDSSTSISTSVSDTLVMKGQEYTYSSILGLVTLLDLSSNNFSGQIPSELTTLTELKSLNLSNNQLTGRIPTKIGDMKELESFDLSMNKLSGELPTSLSRLNFLSSFNISYNNLTGRVPTGTQLQGFNESSFFGNKLCGAPLSDPCVPVEVPNPIIGDPNEDGGSEWRLIISIVFGFVTGFWIIVVPLIASTSWRIKYYRLMGKLINV